MPAECRDCGHDFLYPSKLVQHRKRKTPCAPIVDAGDLPMKALKDPNIDQKKCRFCGRAFASTTSMRRHVRESCKIAPNEKNGDAGMDQLYDHTIRRQGAEILEMRQQMVEMTALMDRVVSAADAQIAASRKEGAAAKPVCEVAIQQHGGVTTVDNKKVQVTINVFGNESLDHVTSGRIRKILEESLNTPTVSLAVQRAVLQTAMLVYSDPEHPENLTCYLPNKKTDDALVHTTRDGKTMWEVQPVPLILPPMAQKSIDALFDRQPFEDASTFEPLMVELRASEEEYATGGLLKPILIRNKQLMARALKQLPVTGA
jgi:hypothetical protein